MIAGRRSRMSPSPNCHSIPVGMAPPAPKPGPEKTAVQLSNGLVEQVGNKVRFTVDYKFTGGKPDPKKTYRLLVSIDNTKATKTQAKPLEVKGDKLTLQATVVKEITFTAAAGNKFEMWLTEEAGTDPQGSSISNIFKGKVTVSLSLTCRLPPRNFKLLARLPSRRD